MNSPLSHLRCIECGSTYEAMQVRYRCDACDGLLEVEHDLLRIRETHPDLRSVLDQRLVETIGPHGSGVWRYHEMILPDLPVDRAITMGEGNTTLYRSPKLNRLFDCTALHIKHEGENPTLSFKDRGMTAGVSWARHLGATRVACASTGDTSAAMAAYAANVEGMQAIVFLPADKVSSEQLAQPICYGAMTLAIDTDFDGCMRLVREVCSALDIYLLNSMNSLRIEGQKTIGIEACQQLGWKPPHWFVIPVGNAGNISALGKGLIEAHALGLIGWIPRIAAVQAEAADPFYQSARTGFREHVTVTAQPTAASAIRIGDPVSHDKAKRVVQRFEGVVEHVTEDELMDAKARADSAGVAVCPNSGVALAGLRKLREAGTIERDDTVVVIATAHGAKFSQLGVEFHTGAMTLPSARRNGPIEVSADLDEIIGVLERSSDTAGR